MDHKNAGKRGAKYCSARTCSNCSVYHTKISFFRFPKDENRCKEWATRAGRTDLVDKPPSRLYTSYRLCSEHFTDSDFMGPDKQRLMPNALPSKFKPFPVTVSSSRDRMDEMQEAEETVSLPQSTEHQPRFTNEVHAMTDVSVMSETVRTQISTSTPPKLPTKSQPTPRTKKRLSSLKTSLSRVRTKLARSKRKITFYKQSKVTSESKTSLEACLKYARQKFNDSTFKLFKAQLLLQNKNKYGRRWTKDMKLFALNLFFHSPRAYRLCAKFLSLPTVRSLQLWLQTCDVKTGINEHVKKLLLETIPTLTESEKLCILCMDEMALKKDLFYNRRKDKIVGYQDLANEHSSKIANEALMFMIRWVTKHWKQPLGYYFSSDATPADTLKLLVVNCVKELMEIGLKVIAIVCDQGPNNQSMQRKLGITIDVPFFLVNSQKVFYFNDTPHLLKNFRNNFKKYGLKIAGNDVSWKHLETLFNCSHPLRLKLAPKLTQKHITVPPFKSMKVSLAAQVFSNSVAVAMETFIALGKLPGEAIHTANFLERMDRLFDTFNSSKRVIKEKSKLRFAIHDASGHISFLQDTKEWLKSLKFNCARQPPSLKGWQINISSLLLLWTHLRDSFNIAYLLTRRLNQDCLENCFSVIRQKQGSNDNPTCAAFENAFKQILVSAVFKMAESSNCEDDTDIIFQQLHSCPSWNALSSSVSQASIDVAETELNHEIDLIEKNAQFYVAGYIIKKFLEKHCCDHCRKALVESNPCFSDQHQMFTYLKAMDVPEKDFGNLTISTSSFFNLFNKWEQKFNETFSVVAHLPCVRETFKAILNSVNNSEVNLCDESVKEMFVDLYLNIRIMWAVRFKNREIHRSDESYASKKLRKLAHV